ncbi:MAG: hypothetical protein N2204_06385 [Anaerolineae bacterium]|nr:hypothetical protein [Anaerolineae bacterium]
MAKKKMQPRRVPRSSEPRMYGNGKPSQTAQATQSAGPAPSSAGGGTTGAGAAARVAPSRVPVTVTQDYSYVLQDLRRLGILAAATFAVLIALGLIIR